jgi:hypothetical protein
LCLCSFQRTLGENNADIDEQIAGDQWPGKKREEFEKEGNFELRKFRITDRYWDHSVKPLWEPSFYHCNKFKRQRSSKWR